MKSLRSVDFVAYDLSRDAYLNTSNYCVDVDADTDADGVGWDGVRACRMGHTLPRTCEDSDGDYWGWDDTQSCKIDALSKEAIGELFFTMTDEMDAPGNRRQSAKLIK